jgi:hypothetical protein
LKVLELLKLPLVAFEKVLHWLWEETTNIQRDLVALA